jgi:hypothetical protein
VASNKELEIFSQVEMKEKNIIHHLNELMDIEKQHSSSSEARWDEVNSFHASSRVSSF